MTKNKLLLLLPILLLLIFSACQNRKNKARKFNDRAIEVYMYGSGDTDFPDDSLRRVRAIELLDSAILCDPSNYLFYANKAQFYSESGEDSLAVIWLKKSAEHLRDFAEGYMGIGMSYDKLNQADSARHYYRKAYDAYFRRTSLPKEQNERTIKINVPMLIYFLTDDADSARRFLYEGIDTSGEFYRENKFYFDMYEDFPAIDSALFPNGRATQMKEKTDISD